MAGVSDCFGIGSIVSCKTCYNREIEGEVMAFDPQTKMLILKCSSSSGRANFNNVHVINLSLVSDVQVKKEVTTAPDPPQSLNLQRLNTRVRNSVEEKKRLIMALNAGVSPDGQKLFLTISKTIQEVNWNGADIVVLNQVRITPPYKPENVIGNVDSKAFTHIKKVPPKSEPSKRIQEVGSAEIPLVPRWLFMSDRVEKHVKDQQALGMDSSSKHNKVVQ